MSVSRVATCTARLEPTAINRRGVFIGKIKSAGSEKTSTNRKRLGSMTK